MSSRMALFSALLLSLSSTAAAGEEKRVTIGIEVAGEDGMDGKHFMINSEDLGFDLDEMQVGESRSIVDESGQSILVTRGEDGFSFNIDGETIDLMDFSAEHGAIRWIDDGEHSDVNVQVIRDVDVTTSSQMSGTMILSPKPIDAATQQAIRSLLESAGYDSDVNFVDHDGAQHGQVMIKKVERKVVSPQT